MTSPLIDVLITIYNGAKTVRASVESIQHQTFKDIRILLVDDGSTDGTLDILYDIAKGDPRVEVVAKPHSGIVDSLNVGLAHCRAEIIARFDADDIAYPGRFATQLAYLQAHPDCMAVASSAIHIDENDRPLGTHIIQRPLDQADAAWIPCREPYLLQPFLMIRKASIDVVHGYRLCEVAEDSDLYWRLNEIGKLHNTDEILGAYRMNPHSVSSKSIINGRRLAFWSQLVGISALRRRNGLPDITFNADRIKAVANAVTLEDFCSMGGEELNETEQLRLRISSSVKLMELALYRPFELEKQDCRYIRKYLKEGCSLLYEANRNSIKPVVMATGMRLILKGKLVETWLLVKLLVPYVIFRVAFRTLLPNSFRSILKNLIGKESNTS